MGYNWDIFIDEVKDGGTFRGLGALVLHADVAEVLSFQLRSQIAKREGSCGKIGEIHWSKLGNIEANIAKDWITHFFSGPLMFFVYLRAKENESKLEASIRLIEHLEIDPHVPGGFSRGSSTLHLDIDFSDPKNILRKLRRSFGLLRAFKWDSKSSLLLQLSDLLLGLARMDCDASLHTFNNKSSKGMKKRMAILEHARIKARMRAESGNTNAVIELNEMNEVKYCLLWD